MTTANPVTHSKKATLEVTLSNICHFMGYLSIIASVATWYFAQDNGTVEAIAHAERFGIFIGLWAPTFFILSSKYKN